VKSLLVKIFTPYWPRAEEATMGDYDDDSDVDAAHVHDAAGNIIERRPKTALFIMALREEVFLGAEVHNQQMQEKIQGFKGPTAPTKKALNDTKKYLDSMDSMVKVLSGYKDCASESLSPEDQVRYHLDLLKDANWCKANPERHSHTSIPDLWHVHLRWQTDEAKAD
jgi:hypothetical protein